MSGRKCKHCLIPSISNYEGAPTVFTKCGHCGYIAAELYKNPTDSLRKGIKDAIDSFHRIHDTKGCPNWPKKEYDYA